MGTILEAALATLRRRWRTVLLLALAFVGRPPSSRRPPASASTSVSLDVFPGISEGIIDDMPLLTAAQFERLGGAFLGLLLATLWPAAGQRRRRQHRHAVLGRASLEPGAWCGRPGRPAARAQRRGLHARHAAASWASAAGALAMTSAVSLLSSGPIDARWAGCLRGPHRRRRARRRAGLPDDALGARLPVMAMEDAGWRLALARSWELSAGQHLAHPAGRPHGQRSDGPRRRGVVSQLLAIVVVDLLAAAAGIDATVAESLVVAARDRLARAALAALLAVLYVDLRARHATGDRPATGQDDTGQTEA